MADPKLYVLKFDSEVCGPCIAMNKKGVLDDLAKSHPNITLVNLTIIDREGEVPKGSIYDAAYDLSEPESYDVQSTPTVVIVTEDGTEVARVDGNPIMKHTDAEKLYDEAVKNAADAEIDKALKKRLDGYIAKWGTQGPAKVK